MKHLPRTQETVNVNLRDRVRNLERGRPANPRPQTQEIIPIANSGAMTTGRSSPYPVRIGGQVVAIVITARCTTTGSSTFRLRVNGTLTGNTITLPSGTNPSVTGYAGNIRVAAGTVLDLECLTADAALADLGGHIALKG